MAPPSTARSTAAPTAPDGEILFDRQRTVPLPCGRVVTVVPLDGHCQVRLTPDREGRFEDVLGAISDVLARVVKTVDGKRLNPEHLRERIRAWPHGSRMMAFAWSRILTYGSACEVPWTCNARGPEGRPCGRSNLTTVELDELPVTPYDAALLGPGLPVTIRSQGGRAYTFRVKVDSAITSEHYANALARKEASPLDAPLAQVVLVAIDGAEVKAPPPKQALATLLDTVPGDVLDHLRQFVMILEPRTFVGDAERARWVEKVNGVLRRFYVPEAGAEGSGDVDGAVVATGGDGPALPNEESAGGSGGADEPEALLVPQGGLATRFQVRCEHCGAVSWQTVETSLDFFARHLKGVGDD
jgi:hypothetical protein